MRNYKKEELENKSKYELSKIVINEGLSNIYNIENGRKNLIEKILENRSYSMLNRILDLNEKSFNKIQEIIDKDLILLDEKKDSIIFEDILKIYIDIDSEDNYIKIYKEINIALDIVFIVNFKKYIYAIAYLEFDSLEKDYYKYKLIIPKELNRFFSEDIKESLYFIFLEKNVEEIIYNEYYNQDYDKFLNRSVYSFKVKIEKYSIKKIEKDFNKNLYIKIENNMVITNVFKSEFFVLLLKNTPSEIFFFGKNAQKYILDNNFLINETYFSDLYEFLNDMNVIENCIDFFENSKSIDKKYIINKYFKWIVRKSESISKIKYNKAILLTENEGLKKIIEDIEVEDIKKCINLKYVEFEKTETTFLMFNFLDDSFSITKSVIKIKDEKINYNIKIFNVDLLLNRKCNINNILDYLIKYIKLSIFNHLNNKKIESLFDYKKNFFSYIKNNSKKEIEGNIENKLKIVEKFFSTEYKSYKNVIKNSSAQRNYNYLKYLAYNLFEMYFENENSNSYNFEVGNLRNLEFLKNHIDEIIKYSLYNELKIFFSKNNLIDILKTYKFVKLNGNILKTNAFLEILKEFIPGSLISINTKEEISVLEKAVEYDKLIYNGNIILEYFKKKINIKFSLYYIDYKSNKVKIIDNDGTYSYIDKSINLNNMDFELILKKEYDNEEIFNFNIDFNIEYIELDEDEFIKICEININNVEINEITNNVIRLFFKFNDDNLIGYFVRRKNDQIYYYKYTKNTSNLT